MLPSRACWLAKASDKPKEATASGGGEGAGEQVGAGDSDKHAGVDHRHHEVGVEVVRDGAYKGAGPPHARYAFSTGRGRCGLEAPLSTQRIARSKAR